MSLPRVLFFVLLVFYFFIVVLSSDQQKQSLENKLKSLQKRINETQQLTLYFKENIVRLENEINYVKSNIKAEESSLNATLGILTTEGNKLLSSINKLTNAFAKLNESMVSRQLELKYLNADVPRILFAIKLVSADYEFYDGLNKSGIQKACFEFERNATWQPQETPERSPLQTIFLAQSLQPVTEDPKIIYLNSILVLALQNLTEVKTEFSLKIIALKNFKDYLVSYKNITANLVKDSQKNILILEENEKNLFAIIQEKQKTLGDLVEKVLKASEIVKEADSQLAIKKKLLEPFEPAIECYKNMKNHPILGGEYKKL